MISKKTGMDFVPAVLLSRVTATKTFHGLDATCSDIRVSDTFGY